MGRLFVLIVFCLGIVSVMPARAQDPSALTESERQAESDKLDWISSAGQYDLPLSHSFVGLPDGAHLLVGDQAARYDWLWNGIESPGTEALLSVPDQGYSVYFVFEAAGFVTEDDWDDVDADDFLTQLKADEAAENAERQKQGLEAFYINGWVERPSFDAETKTAYWAFDLYNDAGDTWINATAISLSREGYHRIIWVGAREDFQSAAASLAPTLAAHDYEVGHRHQDFQDGDKLAGYGIGALAAAVLGVKLGKGMLAVIGAFLLVFLKKGWIVIAVAAAAIGRVFYRRRQAAASGIATPPDSGAPPTH
jgi:uncharacterized membrane-anchored protein